MAFNLTRAAGALASLRHAKATTATVRAQLIRVPARLARSARRLILHLPRDWPWEPAWRRLFRGGPRPARRLSPNHTPCGARPETRRTSRTSRRVSPRRAPQARSRVQSGAIKNRNGGSRLSVDAFRGKHALPPGGASRLAVLPSWPWAPRSPDRLSLKREAQKPAGTA